MIVPVSSPHSADFHLAEKCLAGDWEAIRLLQERFGELIFAFLRRAGASEADAREVVDGLWADCLAPDAAGRHRLSRYNGECALQTWLNRVALNRLLSNRRSARRREHRAPLQPITEGGEGDLLDGVPEEGASFGTDDLLLDAMRSAIQAAFDSCSAEDFVLLQLAHSDELKLSELSLMFDRSQSALSRQIQRAEREIAASTLAHVRRIDPLLELKWDDFLELCRAGVPACFGNE